MMKRSELHLLKLVFKVVKVSKDYLSKVFKDYKEH